MCSITMKLRRNYAVAAITLWPVITKKCGAATHIYDVKITGARIYDRKITDASSYYEKIVVVWWRFLLNRLLFMGRLLIKFRKIFVQDNLINESCFKNKAMTYCYLMSFSHMYTMSYTSESRSYTSKVRARRYYIIIQLSLALLLQLVWFFEWRII